MHAGRKFWAGEQRTLAEWSFYFVGVLVAQNIHLASATVGYVYTVSKGI